MSLIILFFWLSRVLTISFDSNVLRLGVPVFMLSLLFIFLMINKRSLTIFLKTTFAKNYLALFLISLISSAIAFYNGMPVMSSLAELMKLLLMGGFFFLGFILCLYNKKSVALGALTAAIFIHISCGIIGYFLGVGIIIDDVLRPTGITGRVNILANIALFSCVFYGIRCFLESKNRWFLFYISFSSFVLILLSGTLKNLISLFGAYAVYVFLSSKNKIKSVFFFIIIALPCIYAVIFYTPIGDRLIETALAGVNVEVEEGEKLESSLQWRVLHWKLLLDDWFGRFFYQGSGIGQAVNMNALKISDGKGYSAHSDWLKYFVELGPILFSLFIYYHYKLVKPLYDSSKEGAALESATFYSFIALVIAMLAGPVYFTVCFFYFFWLILGVIAGNGYVNSHKAQVDNRQAKPLQSAEIDVP